MILGILLTPLEVIGMFIGGVLALLGLGATSNRNRKSGGKRGKNKKR